MLRRRFRKDKQSTNSNRTTQWLEALLSAGFWLLVWHIGAKKLGQEILLVSPGRALATLVSLLGTQAFYASVGFTLLRVLLGFALALLAGVVLAVIARFVHAVRAVLQPLMSAAKATPVASFIILALIWLPTKSLSVFTSFLMALPIFYINVLEGLSRADKKLLEMAQVFRVPFGARLKAIYAPSAYPFFLSAIASSFGMCWKAGIAAEVIGVPDGSIGEALYRAKIFLNTPELFAWTIAVMLLSVLLEKGLMLLVGRLSPAKALERTHI